jgi:dipeptidyl aminopeptidase/acylaminoacyl peptidase
MAGRGSAGPSGKAGLSLCLPLAFLLLLAPRLDAQKRPLNTGDIESWRRITEKVISPDGRWIAYKTEPWKGDSRIYLYSREGENKFEYDRGTDIEITDDSAFMIFTVKPGTESIREAKLRKTEKTDVPGDLLGIYAIRSGKLDLIKKIKNSKVPEKWAGWLAYQVETPAEEAGGEKTEAERRKKESEKNGFRLHLRNLENGVIRSWPFVTEYHFAEKARKMIFVSTGDAEEWAAGIYFYDLETEKAYPVMTGQKEYKQITVSEKGGRLAFLLKPEDESRVEGFSLYLWDGQGRAEELVNKNSPGMPENWRISENGRISYSDDGKRIFFGTAPLRPERDADIPDDEFPCVDVWHGGEGELHSVQLANRDREMKRAYLAVYDLENRNLMQIETEDTPRSRLLEGGDADVVLLHSSAPYELQSMWDPLHYDVTLLDLTTGRRWIIKKNIGTEIQASPGGEYLFWFNYDDYSYYTYHIETGREHRITEPAVIRADFETNTTFDRNEPYGSAGWLEDDRAVLIYDRYDIWKVDPENNHEPENLTVGGRRDKIVYRLIRFDKAGDPLDGEEMHYLIGTDEVSRSSGYYRWALKSGAEPERLTGGAYRLSNPVKAEKSDTVVYTKETFNTFPDLLVSDLEFRNSIRISEANPQQSDFLWGTAELYEWTSLDGRRLEGLLYKPEGFDPSKKYPMIVQFFHKSSGELYYHRGPELPSSRIDYHYYTSNGYVIFNPDVYFDLGYIGESAYKSVMPGVTALVDEGFIDPDRIGAQGHSYSGYQLAYLATRTRMFACIQSGAPVVNFFSAYGGIRWESGRSRAFQYEHHQTLGSIWEVPLRFFENSPLFFMDKVTTPILIMHNDRDGAVPWSQGIEYFIALRRLQKPVWMLNYNGEPHGLRKLKNKRDFHIRMAQFFGHYLKGEPMPRWMKEGVPAVEKDTEPGYEYMK